MKTRILSAAVGIVLLAAAVVFMDTIAYPIMIAAVGLICIFEITRSFSLKIALPLGVLLAALFVCVVLCAVFGWYDALFYSPLILPIFGCVALVSVKSISFSDSALMLTVSLIYIIGFSALLFAPALLSSSMRFAVLMCFFIPLCGDAAAYFVGSRFGKRKLAPNISPNKSVEGAVAAICVAPVLTVAMYFLCRTLGLSCAAFDKLPVVVVCAVLFGLGIVGAVVGIIGDLFSSAVKRHCGVKDFGNIMPGHGGASDRLDSVVFVSPVVIAVFVMILN